MTEDDQRTFDWTQADFEVSEGVKFDPEIDYNFEITEIKGISGIKDGKEWKAVKVSFAEEETGVALNKSFFVGKVTKNRDSPEKSNDLVKFAIALGYKPEIGTKLDLKNMIRTGMKISARVVPQTDRKGKETGFQEINLATVKALGKKAMKPKHQPIDTSLIDKWQAEISKGQYSTKEIYMKELAKTGRTDEIEPFLNACAESQLKF